MISSVNVQLTPKQVAQAIGVSESSLKRWCDQGLLLTVRTAGGHRRLTIDAVTDFLRRTGRQPIRPELLGLPVNAGRGNLVVDRAATNFAAALEEGDEQQAERIVVDLFLARHSISEIGDLVVAPSLRRLGDRWSCGEVEVYEERRSCTILMRILGQLRVLLRQPPVDGPVAIGGTLLNDFAQIPTTLVEMSLRERGWQATSLGSGLPAATFCQAIVDYRPRLVWISASHIENADLFLEHQHQVFATAQQLAIPVVVGGAALNEAVRPQLWHSSFCEGLRNLEGFVDGISPPVE